MGNAGLDFKSEVDLLLGGPLSVGDTIRLFQDISSLLLARRFGAFSECEDFGCGFQSSVAMLDGTATVVPLPPTLSLMVTGLALAGLVTVGRRRRSR